METGSISVNAMLCDYAEVSGQKLFVTGAGISWISSRAEPPHPVNIALALLVRIPWGATNHQHRLTIELVSDLGAADNSESGSAERVALNNLLPPGAPEQERGMIISLFNAGRAPNMLPGEDVLMPVAIPLLGLPLPRLGSYFFSLSVDGTEVDRISFRAVTVSTIMTGFPPMVAPG